MGAQGSCQYLPCHNDAVGDYLNDECISSSVFGGHFISLFCEWSLHGVPSLDWHFDKCVFFVFLFVFEDWRNFVTEDILVLSTRRPPHEYGMGIDHRGYVRL